MPKRTRLNRNMGSQRRERLKPIRSSADIGTAFWGVEAGRTMKHGYTPRGVRDEIVNENGKVQYNLWGNNIATFDKAKNLLTLRDTGWKTPTTKDRLNSVLTEKFTYKTYIGQERHVWYIFHKDKKYEWSDGDNKIDMSNPTQFLTPVSPEKMTAKVKEQKKIADEFVKGYKEKIFDNTMTPQDYENLSEVFSERGRPQGFEMLFLRDEHGNWDYNKIKEHWDLIRMDLRWYINRKIAKGEVPEKGRASWSTSIKPQSPFFLFVPSINEMPPRVRAENANRAFALGEFYSTNDKAMAAVRKAGYIAKEQQATLKKQGYLRLI